MTLRLFLFLFLLTCLSLNNQAQDKIAASYLSINLVSGEQNIVKWQPMHKKPGGDFKLNWLKNGDISMEFNLAEGPIVYKKILDLTDKEKKYIKQKIGDFSLKGVYFNKKDPNASYHFVYVNPALENSVLITFQYIIGKVAGATYYSSKPVNPFEKKNIQITDPNL